jgi:hypothetical protein
MQHIDKDSPPVDRSAIAPDPDRTPLVIVEMQKLPGWSTATS